MGYHDVQIMVATSHGNVYKRRLAATNMVGQLLSRLWLCVLIFVLIQFLFLCSGEATKWSNKMAQWNGDNAGIQLIADGLPIVIQDPRQCAIHDAFAVAVQDAFSATCQRAIHDAR